MVLVDDLLLSMDRGCTSILILIHLSTAFDAVDQEILQSCLRKVVGVQGNVLKWSESFLEGHSQQIMMGKFTSLVDPSILDSQKDQFSLQSFIASTCNL